MPEFSANISTLFTESPMLERIERARRAGFSGIEIQFPYAEDATQLKSALDDSGLPLVLINFPAGDLMHGGEGYAAVPGREVEFEEALEQACACARQLKPRAMNLLCGRPGEGRGATRCLQVFESHLVAAHARLRPLGIRLVTEAINRFDQPGFFLPRAHQVIDLIERLSKIELFLQLDLYHAIRMGDDPAQLLRCYANRIGHIQFADHPGRGEPGSGELDFESLFALIDSLPYDGFVGAEYNPSTSTDDSLEWLRRYRDRSTR